MTIRHRSKGIGVVALIFGVFATFMMGGFDWITDWGFWLISGLTVGGLLWRSRNDWYAAGAVWVQCGKNWVNMYELTKVRFTINGLNRVLQLTDSSGRHVPELILKSVQANQPMWDLVYNGILHSVASGNCDISDKARTVLKIPAELGQTGTD